MLNDAGCGDAHFNRNISESDEISVKADNPENTTFTSGYIDLKGYFYGCEDRTHSKFSIKICEEFGIEYGPDAEQELDFIGWVKVCNKSFFWFRSKFLANQKQVRTMKKLMKNYELVEGYFNHISKKSTLEEALEENRAVRLL